MIIGSLKANLSKAVQKKLKNAVEYTVERKLRNEVKKITKKLTIHFIISGVALAGTLLLSNNADKIVDRLIKPKNE